MRSPWGLSRSFSAASIAVKPSTFRVNYFTPERRLRESQGLEFGLKLMTDAAYTICYIHIYLSIDGRPLAVEVAASGKSPVSNLNLLERRCRLNLLSGQ